jgi:DNA invertase Pin-like site-specific DNA recombinase
MPRDTQGQPAPLRAFIYNRASRDPKRRGRSTDDQSAENHAECDEQGWQVVGEFTDTDRSASRHAKRTRDEFESMAARIRAGECDVLVTWESSRANRSMDGYVLLRQLCEETGVLWHYGGHTYDMTNRRDRRDTAQDALQAEDEAEAIRDRNLRTVRLNAAKGRPHGRIPFGYAREYDPASGELIAQVLHPTESRDLAEAYRRYAAGESAPPIAAWLNSQGHRTRAGYEWNGDALLKIMRNQTNLGKRKHQGTVIRDALWPALIDPETFWAVQSLLSLPGRNDGAGRPLTHLLSGIAICGVCKQRDLYILKNRTLPSYTCRPSAHVVMLKTRLEAYVEESLVEWLSTPQSAEAFKPVDRGGTTAAILAEIDELNTELQEARQLAASRKLSVLSLAALEAGLQPRIEKLQSRLHRATVPPALRDLLGAPDADARWNALPLERRRAVLRACASITVNRGRKGVRRIEPGRVDLWFGPQATPDAEDSTSDLPS